MLFSNNQAIWCIFWMFKIHTAIMKSNYKLNDQQSAKILLGKDWLPHSSEINPFSLNYCPSLLVIDIIVILIIMYFSYLNITGYMECVWGWSLKWKLSRKVFFFFFQRTFRISVIRHHPSPLPRERERGWRWRDHHFRVPVFDTLSITKTINRKIVFRLKI